MLFIWTGGHISLQVVVVDSCTNTNNVLDLYLGGGQFSQLHYSQE
jgi:hypothetical protein